VRAMVALTIYVWAGLFRLAKFNITADHSASCFSGLPTPMGACFLASIVMYHPWFAQYGFSFLIEPKGLMIATLIIAGLMVSLIPFPSVKQYNITHYYAALLFCSGMLFAGIGLLGRYPSIFFMSSLYIIVSLCVFTVNAAIRLKASKF